jgi:tetratricopeptide (TPR) repeat protein
MKKRIFVIMFIILFCSVPGSLLAEQNKLSQGLIAHKDGKILTSTNLYLEALKEAQSDDKKVLLWKKLQELPFTIDNELNIKLARTLIELGFRENVLIKYKNFLHTYPESINPLRKELCLLAGAHNISFTEMVPSDHILTKEDLDFYLQKVREAKFPEIQNTTKEELSFDRQLAELRVCSTVKEGKKLELDFYDFISEKIKALTQMGQTVDFVTAHLREDEHPFKKRIAKAFLKEVSWHKNRDLENRKKVLADLKALGQKKDLISSIKKHADRNGTPVHLLEMANYCREKKLYTEALRLENKALYFFDQTTKYVSPKDWSIKMVINSLCMVKGYEEEVVRYGLLKKWRNPSVPLITAYLLCGLNRINEAVEVFVAAKQSSGTMGSWVYLPNKKFKTICKLKKAVLKKLLRHPSLSKKQLKLLKAAYPEDIARINNSM